MLNNSASKILLLKSAALLMAIGFAYFAFTQQYRAIFDPCNCADAYAYTKIGQLYAEHGFALHEWSKLRLYAYPLFIAAVDIAASWLAVDQGIALFAVQLAVYFSAVILLSGNLTKLVSLRVGNLVFFALTANVFLYPYLAISLSDGMSVSLLIFIAALIVHMQSSGLSAARVFLMGVLLGLGIMVRPANLYWLAMPVVLLGLFAWSERQGRGWLLLRFGAALVLGFFLAVLPQIIINYRFFDELTFLPVFKLGSFQIRSGILMIKYGTNMTGNGPPAMVYPNIWFNNAVPDLSWYFLHPWLGVRTMFLHLFSALDFDYLFCYIYDLRPKYRPVLFLYSQTVLFWGVVGFFAAARDIRVWEQRGGTKPKASVVFMALLLAAVLGWCAVTSISAVENRFSLPMVAILLPLAAWALIGHRWENRRSLILCGSLFCCYLIFAAWVSYTISSLVVLPNG